MTPEQIKTMDGYIRVSRVGTREGDTFISPEVQRKKISQWAKLRDVEIVAWHEDLDVSGAKTADERPGLAALMERIRKGETGGVAVAALDRLSRLGLLDSLKLIAEIREHGGTFAAIDLGVDPTTDGGEIALNVMLTLAGQQRRRLAAAWTSAQAEAIERGVHIGPVPLGYVSTEDGTLEPDEDGPPVELPIGRISTTYRSLDHDGHAGAVEAAYKLAATEGVGAALAFLKGLHLKREVKASQGKRGERGGDTVSRERQWDGTMLRRLLASRTYLGEVRHGDEFKADAHEALVDERTYALANLATGKAKGSTPAASAAYPLSGLCRCGTCGEPMHGHSASGGRAYRCRGAKGGKCPSVARMMADPLEVYVREQALAELRKRNGDGGLDPFDALRAAEGATATAGDELVAWSSKLAAERGDAGSPKRRAYDAGLARREQELADAQQRLEAAQLDVQTRHKPTIKALKDAEGDELGRLLRGVLKSITVAPANGHKGFRPERVTIELHAA